MALTFGQMVDQILMETNRTGNPIFSTEVQNAVVSAIKELETEELFLNQKMVEIPTPPYAFTGDDRRSRRRLKAALQP